MPKGVAAGIARVFGEAAANFLNAIFTAVQKLKPRRPKNRRRIAVEVLGIDAESIFVEPTQASR